MYVSGRWCILDSNKGNIYTTTYTTEISKPKTGVEYVITTTYIRKS